MQGDPKFQASQDLPDVPYHKFAELIGLRGIYVDDPEQLAPAWDEALGVGIGVDVDGLGISAKGDPRQQAPRRSRQSPKQQLTTVHIRSPKESRALIERMPRSDERLFGHAFVRCRRPYAVGSTVPRRFHDTSVRASAKETFACGVPQPGQKRGIGGWRPKRKRNRLQADQAARSALAPSIRMTRST